jgi:hypothetical protein
VRTAATDGEVRQDKLLELRELQLPQDRLPALRFHHSCLSERTRPYPIRSHPLKSQDQGGLQPSSSAFKNPQPVALHASRG